MVVSGPVNREDRSRQMADCDAAALEVERLTCSYPGVDVLSDLSFRVWPGERVGLIGPNGAGKTTLFLTVAGVQEPDAGAVRLFGRDTSPPERRAEIGMVFQNASDQLFCPTVREDVAFGPTNQGLGVRDVDKRVAQALWLTGTAGLADRAPHRLSGGEKRMVSIAGVLAMEPRLILYDEPNANLDIRSRRRLIDFLGQAEDTTLIASHDLELILEVCSRVLVLDEGTLCADGRPKAIMSDAQLMARHGLEKPHSLVPHADPHHPPPAV
jgi:cobalt/nickel transport system ATP-binding protein